MSELGNKTLILTGAWRGIGRALALGLAQAGARLVLNARHPSPLGEVAVECKALGVQVRYVMGNAAEAETVLEMVNTSLNLGDFYVQSGGRARPVGRYIVGIDGDVSASERSLGRGRGIGGQAILPLHSLLRAWCQWHV
jgi:NAD(P)-dependent dehydrogenase (short-subunit alcohol dehydrogenase family)